jgi:phosphoribosylglycinamide formyltransferase-1
MVRKKIAILASGSGTNAENLIRYFADNPGISIHLVLSNKKDAYVLKRAEKHNIPTMVFSRQDFYETGLVLEKLQSEGIDFIVLAGFLWLIPEDIIRAFPNKIVNIHPALLPKYGGKGMYGSHVHEAVLNNKDKESGISIHYVNEKYDEGAIIFQARCPVLPDDTTDSLAERIHRLEYKHYPEVIKGLLSR